jgi:cell division septal protein FtsQ
MSAENDQTDISNRNQSLGQRQNQNLTQIKPLKSRRSGRDRFAQAAKYIFLAILCLTSAAVFLSARNAGIFKVDRFAVVVQPTQDELNGTMGSASALHSRLVQEMKSYLGKNIWETDLKGIYQKASSDAWVGSIGISRLIPNRIQIEIIPRRAAAMIAEKNGELLPVTFDAKVMPKLGMGQLPDFPLLRGEIFRSSEPARLQALALLELQNRSEKFQNKNISDISYTQDSGYILNLISPRIEVRLGTDGFDIKLARATQVLNYLNSHQLSARVIDATFSKKVLVRLRKGS